MNRPVTAMRFPDTTPAEIADQPPVFEWVDPSVLLVDEVYQRELSNASVDLIRRILARWDWARFKPPIVARTAAGLEVIDGQHTAIAAASHPKIDRIPVMIVDAPEVADRASAFVGHNKDRLNLSQVAIHHAKVAAGDQDAIELQAVCDKAGVTLLKHNPGREFRIGETFGLIAVRGLINRRGVAKARQVLEVLVKAHCAPLAAAQIKAVDMLLSDPEYRGQVEAADLSSALMALGARASAEAQVFAAAHNVPIWRGLAVVLFKEARRGRRRAA